MHCFEAMCSVVKLYHAALLQRMSAVSSSGLPGRAPTYCLRVNTLKTSAAALADELIEAGARLLPSHLLPDDFLCVEAGLQVVFSAGAVANGLCQVRHLRLHRAVGQ